ncbi:hypothetical protein E2562_022494 [Oryza meyeriana var. granulata]|uniref:Uncharacterized protein n=1 Tax=Oryza meyeriana var. granulata TaxID=110450 RepID=A0A6G1BLM5_9ORYZ|nr:hypothetical protein E2562_022494 [Oryza meyeriana var. granulata]
MKKKRLLKGKYYLWGVCKARKDNPRTAILVEQNGLACASEEAEVQEHQILDRQYEVQCESSDKESFVVKHVEDQLLADCNHEAQKGDTKTAFGEGCVSHDSCLSSNKPSPAKAGSHCFMQPRVGHKPLEPGVADQQEQEQDFTSLPRRNDQNATNSPTTLFGFVTARSARSQQLIEEMVKEGALLFSVPEEMMITGSTISKNNGVGHQHMQECRKPIEFVPIDHGDHDEASGACLELFPVRQEHIGLTPMIDANREVELDLSLGACRRAPSGLP